MRNSLTDYLFDSAEAYTHKTAVITYNSEIDFTSLKEMSMNLSHFFIEKGIKRGDRILICIKNSIDAIVSFWAGLIADAVVSIIDHHMPEEKIKYIINDSGASAIIIHDIDKYKYLHNYERLLILDINDELIKKTIFIQKKERQYQPKHLDIDLACIIYTSGSTGEPKGVMLTHRNMLAASHSINSYLGNTSEDRVISALPLSFDYGLYQMIMMIAVGGTLILESDFILPSRFLKLIEKTKPTAVPVVPSMVPLLKQFNALKPYDLSSVRYATNTGAALMKEHINTLKDLFKNALIFSMYGLTECKRCTFLPPKDIDRKPNSVGIAIPNTEIFIVDEHGIPLGFGQLGEIVVRGQTVMKGYWNKPDATKKKLRSGPVPGEFVLHTGDYGMLDDEGYLFFYGRMDEVIKSRGLKVSPREIEAIMISHTSVIEAAAVPIAHEQFGQAIILYVSTNDSVSVAELKDYCKAKLQIHQQPIDIFLLPNLPKTTNGKIDKLNLASRYKHLSCEEGIAC